MANVHQIPRYKKNGSSKLTMALSKATNGREEEPEPARPGRGDNHAFHVVYAPVVSI